MTEVSEAGGGLPVVVPVATAAIYEDMVERVARAIYISKGFDPDEAWADPQSNFFAMRRQEAAFADARAAIEAMREPTEAMAEVGHVAMMGKPDSAQGRREASAAYRAMIDAALS